MALRLAVALCAAMTLPACATVTRGSTQQFTVTSTPPGARVSTSNGYDCLSTPCTFRMSRKDSFQATVSLAGYQSQTHMVESKMAGSGAAGMAGNILVGGIIGVAVDATSGAMNDLTPSSVHATLVPNGTTATTSESSNP